MVTKKQYQERYSWLVDKGRVEDAQAYKETHGVSSGAIPTVKADEPAPTYADKPFYQMSPTEASRYLIENTPSNADQLVRNYESMTGKKIPQEIAYVTTTTTGEQRPMIQDVAGQDHVYEGEMRTEQIPYLREWATQRGARVEIIGEMSTQQGVVTQYRIVSDKDLLAEQRTRREYEALIFGKEPMIAGRPLPESVTGRTPTDALITPVPSVTSLERARRERITTESAIKTTETSPSMMLPLVPVSLKSSHVRTALSPVGLEYVGATVRGRDPTDLVIGQMKKEHTRQLAIKEAPHEQAFRYAVETATSPVFEVYTGIAGAVLLGATGVGAKLTGLAVKGIPVGKVAMAGMGAYYIGASAVEAHASYSVGNIDRAVGRVVTTGATITAGIVTYKMITKFQAPKTTPIDIKAQPSKIKGMSITHVKTPKITKSVGEFVATVKVGKKQLNIFGQVLGKGQTVSKGKTFNIVEVVIPKQRIGKLTVPRQQFLRYVPTEDLGKGIYSAKASEGIIYSADKKLNVVLAGSRRGSQYMVELAKIKRGNAELRLFKGSATETTGRVAPSDLARASRLIARGIDPKRVGSVPRTDVKMVGEQNIVWVDKLVKGADIKAIKPDVKGWSGAILETKTTTPKTKVIPVTKTKPPIVSGIDIQLKGVKAQVTKTTPMTVTTLPAIATISRLRSEQIRSYTPATATIQLQKPITEKRIAVATAIQRIPILEQERKTEYGTRITGIHGINIRTDLAQGTTTAQAFRSATKQQTRLTSASAVSVPVPPPTITTAPPPVFIGVPLPFGAFKGGIRKPKHRIEIRLNPIPKVLKIKAPKLKIKGV